MSDRPEPPCLTVFQDRLIGHGHAAWRDGKGNVFCMTRFRPYPGQTSARKNPPLGIAHGVIVNPDDYEDFLELIGQGGIRY